MKRHKLINEKFNDSPIFLSKKLKKYSRKDLFRNSEGSTLYTLNNENNQSINDQKLNQNDFEFFAKKISNAFDALEQLILDDCSKEENNGESLLKKSSNDKKSHKEDKTNIKNLVNNQNKNKKRSVSIPKLDFSEIFDYYNNNPIYIKKIETKKKSDHKHENHKKKIIIEEIPM